MKTPTIRKDDFYLPTLEVLNELGGSASIGELEDALIERFDFTQEQLDVRYEISGVNILTHKMAWARSYLKFPAFVSNDGHGIWVLTPEGRAALNLSFSEIRQRIREAKKQQTIERAATPEIGVIASADEAAEEALEAEPDWRDQLLTALRLIEPSAFERLCQRLLRESGFVKVEVTGKSGDGGIDGVGVLRMNLISFQVLFQCNRYAGSVSSGAVRDFRGAMQGRADKGLFITTGTFTGDARREATRDGAPAIDLIDGETLCDLLRERRLGVSVQQIVVDEIKIDQVFFATL